jgi:hypothetical protein
MFERFTDRARRVVVLAQEEARLLNHNYIGTEHILLGLIHEGEGVAAHALTGIGIELVDVRSEVEQIIGHGGLAPSGHIPFTPRAKKVLEMSLREALQLQHNYIGTEHILLGLIREGEGVAAQVLVKLGADLSRVRQAVIQLLSGNEGGLAEYQVEPRLPRAQIQPVRCGFCNVPSPACGTLYTGVSGALICESCIASVVESSEPPASTWRSRIQGMVERSWPGRTWSSESVEERAARIQPTGPPPDDEDAARRAITDAFQNTMEVGADGRTLINVEDGEALAGCAEEVRRRVGDIAAQTETVIHHIKFVDATTAAVWSSTLLHGRPPHPGLDREMGMAVFIDGRWKVERDTMCLRWSYAGVHCPGRQGT